MSLVKRNVKGSPLTASEYDDAVTEIENNSAKIVVLTDFIEAVNAAKAAKNGSETEVFKVAPATLSTHAISKAQLDAVITAFSGALIPQGNWNASTNTPNISSTTETGYYWIVGVSGSTDIGGITDWEVNDWAVKTAVGWAKIDNTDKVVSVAGKTGVVTLSSSDLTDSSNIPLKDAISNIFSGSITADSFSGNGSELTSLNATNLTTGTLADERLSSNVVLLDNAQTITGVKTFNDLTWLEDIKVKPFALESSIIRFMESNLTTQRAYVGINSSGSGLGSKGLWLMSGGYGFYVNSDDNKIYYKFNNSVNHEIYHQNNLTKSVIDALNVDADTLDGLDSLDFVRKTGSVTETITGIKNFTNNIGINSAVPEAPIHITGSNFPVAKFERTGSLNNTTNSGFQLLTTINADMVNGFGGGIVFAIKDDAGVENNIGRIAVVRDGADSQGKFVFALNSSLTSLMELSNAGNLSVFGGVTAASFTGNGAQLSSLNASNISSGTLADARLSSNVPLKNDDSIITGQWIFDETQQFNGAINAVGNIVSNTISSNSSFNLILKGGSITDLVEIDDDLQINGKILLNTLNTAPSSASDTGTTGEIRFTADYIYVCVATNTWKRVAISTW